MRLGEQLARSTLRDRHQRLELHLERIAGRHEIGERFLQVLGGHPLALVVDRAQLGAHQRRLDVRPRHLGQVRWKDGHDVAVESHLGLLGHDLDQLDPLLGRLRIEERQVLLGASLPLQVHGQQIRAAGEQEPDDLAAVLGVPHE